MSIDTSIDIDFEAALVSIYPDVREVEFIPAGHVTARLTYKELARLTGLIARVREDGKAA